jgi:dihydrofolate reductase
MGRIVVTEFITLDGVVQDPHLWSFPYWGDDIADVKQAELFASDALLLGRVTYEGFAEAWPGRTDETGFADRINALPKFVVSSTVTEPTWNASVIAADVDAVREAAASVEGDVTVHGSPSLVAFLLDAGLVDEIRLITYPIVRGTGKRLFREGAELKLERVEERPFASGAVLLTYRPAR